MRVEVLKFRAFSDAELLQFAQQGTDAHGVDNLLTPSLNAGYGFTNDFTVGLRLPYVLRTDIREGYVEGGDIGIDARGDSGGVGDLTSLGQYRFLNDHAWNFESAILTGVKIPTGSTGVKDRSGSSFEAEHQPGSGSYRSGSGEHNHASLENTDHQHLAWDLILELNGEWRKNREWKMWWMKIAAAL